MNARRELAIGLSYTSEKHPCQGALEASHNGRRGRKRSDPIAQLQAFVEAQPIGRLASPEEIAAAALFLASGEASLVTGVAFAVDGGTNSPHLVTSSAQ